MMNKIDDIKITLKLILKERKEIIAAFLYGSFLSSHNYNDIDIALLLDEKFEVKLFYKENLELELEQGLKEKMGIIKPIDIQILNKKSIRFINTVLKSSILIVSNSDAKRVQFESNKLTEYLDFKPYLDYYDEMRRLRYVNR